MPEDWDEAKFFIEYTARHGAEDSYIARAIYMWAMDPPLTLIWPKTASLGEAKFSVGWGRGDRDLIGSVIPGPRGKARASGAGENRARRAFHFHKRYIGRMAPFSDDARYLEFRDRVMAIPIA